MMAFNLAELSDPVKSLVTIFLLVLSVGYISALLFVKDTTGMQQSGIVENYVGNEDNEEANEMKFKKSKHEMLNILHTHILSMSVIFFILGGLVSGALINSKLKRIIMIEPLLSVLATFGGIFLIWRGISWMSYIVMISGGLMTISFVGSVFVIIISMYRTNVYSK